jgi:enterochelin esterase-like enzyme
MGPQDTPTLVLSILLSVGAVVGCLLLWSRLPGPNPFKIAARIGMIIVCQFTALVMIFIMINIDRTFYNTWSDLAFDWGFGSDPNAGNQNGILPGNNGGTALGGPKGTEPQIKASFRFLSDTKVYRATITGPASGVTGEVDIWVPPGYDPKADTKYPVVELFSGTPGSPIAWFGAASGIQVGKRAADLISAGRMKPFIMVSVKINIVRNTPNECTDVPGQPKVATWLTKDVRQLMTEHFKVRTEAQSWGMMGYSEGAYCAVKLALQYPKLYGSAVGLAGTYHPDLSSVTGDPKEVEATSPFELIKQSPPVNLLFATSAADKESPPSAFEQLMTQARHPTNPNQLVYPHGGHLTSVWGTMMPKILPQFSAWLNTGGGLQ